MKTNSEVKLLIDFGLEPISNRYLQNVIFPLGINYIAVGMPATYEEK